MSALEGARLVVLICEHRGERHGNVLDGATRAYASGFEANGYRTLTIDCNDFYKAGSEIAALSRDPHVAAFFSVGGKGLIGNLPDGTLARPKTGEKPVIAQHGDHPYQSWVRPIVEFDFETKLCFFNDPASVAFVGRQGLYQGRVFYSPPCIFGAEDAPANVERDIPLLFVGLVDEPSTTRDNFLARYPELRAEFDVITERAVDELRRPLVDVAKETLLALGSELDLLSVRGQQLLNRADWWIRHQRRRRALFRVRRHPLLVIAQSPGRWTGMHPDTRFVTGLPLQEVLQLCSRAKVMLVPQPTYPNGVTERILYAMDRGMAVVANWSPVVDRYFVPGRDLLTYANDYSDIDDRIAEALDERIRGPMSQNARAAVRDQFMPQQIVAGYIARARDAALALAPP
jgi:hypothetical protein